MSLLSKLAARRLGLVPLYSIDVRRGVPVPGPGGVELRTDVYAPRGRARGPTILIRSPYGRRPFGFSMATPLATQGYHVVLQSCRGTAGSSGVFDPHHDEHGDGLATLDWIKAQPWFDGSIVTHGGSYLGYTQWAVAAAAGPEVRAMAMQITLSDFSRMTYAGGSLMLENALSWTYFMATSGTLVGKLRMLARLLGRETIRDDQWRSLPLARLDEVTTGERVSFWQDWMEHGSSEDPWWRPMDFHRTIPDVRCPVSLVSGWHDIFAPWTLADFAALQKAGVPARITVGPWTHTDRSAAPLVMQEALDWYAHHLGQRPGARSALVRLFVMGADAWREFEQWPPEQSATRSWYLQSGAELGDRPARERSVDRYRYDPADPTPSVGGPGLFTGACVVDNAPLERREDVLCFTSPPLDADLDVIGVPAADLFVSSSADSADFFVRLCDVDRDGVSRNVCDGLQRVAVPPDRAPQRVRIELWPTAYRFAGGHRLRLQVSSGAFPRWARNPGTGEPLGTATELRVAEQAIHHSRAHPSAIALPVCAPPGA